MSGPLRILCDGRDLTDVATGLTYSNVDPGGFETCTFSLPSTVDPPRKGARLEIQDGLSVGWRGRVGDVGRSTSPRTDQISVVGEGGGAALRDRSLSEIFIDREAGHWAQSSTARQLSVAQAGAVDLSGGSWSAGRDDAGRPGITAQLNNPPFTRPAAEAWYDAGANLLVSRIRLRNALINLSPSDPVVGDAVYGSATDNGAFTSPIDIRTLTDVDVQLAATRYLLLLLYYVGANGGSAGTTYGAQWTNISVIGTHGLPLRGTDPASDGFWPSDIVRYALAKVPAIAPGVIVDSTDFVAPHSVYRERVPIEQVVGDQAKLAAFHWGVWEPLGDAAGDERDRLDFRPYPPPNEPTCWLSSRHCDPLQLPDRLQSYYSIARVRFEDTATGGRAELTVTDDPPELVLVGDRELLLDMGPGTVASARIWGRLQLEIANNSARASGTASLPDVVRLQGGGSKPARLLRSGLDRLQVVDLPSQPLLANDARSSFRIGRVEVTTDDQGRPRTRVDLDWGLSLIEVLAARLAVVTSVAQGR